MLKGMMWMDGNDISTVNGQQLPLGCTELTLINNRLTNIPDLSHMTKLSRLDTESLVQPPAEVFHTNLSAVRNYFEQQQHTG